MERRKEARIKTRLPCQLIIAGTRYGGLVLSVSPIGCFVQTSAQPAIGNQVEARIQIPAEETPVTLLGTVASKKIVPAALRTVAQGGIGLSIQYAPEAYYSFLMTLSSRNPADRQ